MTAVSERKSERSGSTDRILTELESLPANKWSPIPRREDYLERGHSMVPYIVDGFQTHLSFPEGDFDVVLEKWTISSPATILLSVPPPSYGVRISRPGEDLFATLQVDTERTQKLYVRNLETRINAIAKLVQDFAWALEQKRIRDRH